MTTRYGKKEDVLIKGRTAESSRRDAAAYGVSWSEDGHEAGEVDMVIVAVKPGVVPQVLKEIAPYHPRRVLSIAAAVAISSLEEALPEGTEVIRVMPQYSGFRRRRNDSHCSGDKGIF